MAPEYAMHGQFSEKSDVFSFGVITLEIISAKKNARSLESNSTDDLLSHVSIIKLLIYSSTFCFFMFMPVSLSSFITEK